MSISVERLRVWLLAGAGLLVVVIVSFLWYAHYRAHRFLTNLPAKLGIDVRRETNNVTYSQSVQGRTVYTIHAAKAVERSDGKMTLHDVGIVLYGRKEDRADRIYGKEFEYDQAAGVVRAVGEVHIDLQAPQAQGADAKKDYAAGKDLEGTKAGHSAIGEHESKDERLIHVTTSGLVFLQKLGVAATDNDIEFASGGMTGHAVGADYNSDTGVVVLHSAVRVNGLQHGRPVLLTASHAVLDRPGQTMVLTQAKYVSVVRGDSGGEGQTAAGEHVVVHLRKDGTAERVEAEGDVTLTGATGGSLKAPRGEMMLNEQNQPLSATMSGGVKYLADEPLRQAQGEAAEGHATFAKGHPEHVVMTGAVHLHERVRAADSAAEPWNERELNAREVEVALTTDTAGKTLIRDAKATGEARLNVVTAVAKCERWAQSGTTQCAGRGCVDGAFCAGGQRGSYCGGAWRWPHDDAQSERDRSGQHGCGDSLVAHFRPVAAVAGRGSSADE